MHGAVEADEPERSSDGGRGGRARRRRRMPHEDVDDGRRRDRDRRTRSSATDADALQPGRGRRGSSPAVGRRRHASRGRCAAVDAAGAPAPTTGPTPGDAARGVPPRGLRPRPRRSSASLPRHEVTLTSKRLGEFEADRETPTCSPPTGCSTRTRSSGPSPRAPGSTSSTRSRATASTSATASAPGRARSSTAASRRRSTAAPASCRCSRARAASARPPSRPCSAWRSPMRATTASSPSTPTPTVARSPSASRAPSGKTVRDLVRARARDRRLQRHLVASSRATRRASTCSRRIPTPASPRRSATRDYLDVATLAAHYYSIVLTDTGTGIVHSVMGATLDLADQLVIVVGPQRRRGAPGVRDADLARDQRLRRAGARRRRRAQRGAPGAPLVQLDELESHFRTPRARGRAHALRPAHRRRQRHRVPRPAARDAARGARARGDRSSRACASLAARPRHPMAVRPIRLFGDPVLRVRQRADRRHRRRRARPRARPARHRRAARPRRRRRPADRRGAARLQLQHRRRHRLRAEPACSSRCRGEPEPVGRGMPVGARPLARRPAPPVGEGRRASTSTATRSCSRARACSRRRSSTRPTTSTACCTSSGSRPRPAASRCARSASPTGSEATGPADAADRRRQARSSERSAPGASEHPRRLGCDR